MTAEKNEGGRRLEKEAKEGEELRNAWRDRLRSLILGGEC
jgi:FtsZ-binding cell division protein ZapB